MALFRIGLCRSFALNAYSNRMSVKRTKQRIFFIHIVDKMNMTAAHMTEGEKEICLILLQLELWLVRDTGRNNIKSITIFNCFNICCN